MKKTLPALLLCLASTGAFATEAQNGLQLNGQQLNGFTLNRIAWNVITINAARPADTAIFDELADMASRKLSD